MLCKVAHIKNIIKNKYLIYIKYENKLKMNTTTS